MCLLNTSNSDSEGLRFDWNNRARTKPDVDHNVVKRSDNFSPGFVQRESRTATRAI